ncbi:MAG: FAD-dependent oxidoreductase [Lentisphaerae bacterium]|jgi:hypothetical protein|nr:FAD-dependent oxidoreductase [Lentisphaerota bacterium]MBT4814726.1 FAD-dependent oxidoreductase [Lentisphaerota bacterium]MBT5605622.1 FAD-dependent oxidoreductase [Lentisphaerota bacterium]MBT7059025.1 FAD-dependent oxidoreductase [Lentisphaerota bacterium]MBT7847256.1 FAD-dependent oxidoreductase [Lentisphaerota bacterium]
MQPFICEEDDPTAREFTRRAVAADVVVVGAGPAGICAALAAARGGAKTILISDRPVLGGSASSEVRVTPSGADAAPWNRFARETGIMEELSLRLAHKTELSGIWRWLYYDEMYFDLVYAEPNLEFFLNTTIYATACDHAGHIASVEGIQLRAEVIYTFMGKQFIDCSGDGTVGFLAGADYRVGRENKAEFGETHAPDEADGGTMGATLLFSTVDRGHAVPFTAPDWAIDVRELPTILDPDKSVARTFYHRQDGCAYYGLWWAEYGGDIDSIHDDGEVVWHCRRLVYGLWDYIKNSGKFKDAERQEIDWIGYLPGKRESRRLLGPYIATAHDFLEQREAADTIGHCGWPIDIHPPHGYRDPEPACTHDQTPGVIDIPFGILYSRNIDNLMFAGRNVSVSHEGLGTLRVIATTAVMGQAVGEAAAICVEQETSPAGVHTEHIAELQRRLMREDQSIIGRTLNESSDLSRKATVRASSTASMELPGTNQWQTLTTRFGLIIPVESDLIESIFFHIDPTEETDVSFEVFASDKPQNYRFAQRLGEFSRTVSKREWCEFAIDASPGPGRKLLIVFMANPKIHLGIATDRLTGVLGIAAPDVAELSYRNSFSWQQTTPSFRVTPEQHVFRPAAAVDGHIRPHGLPHCWASAAMDPGQETWLELELAEPAEVGAVELVFNSDLNPRRHAVTGMVPTVIRDYDVVAVTPNGEVTVAQGRENIMRFRRHAFAPVQASALRIRVFSTWGSPRAEILDFRVYPTS